MAFALAVVTPEERLVEIQARSIVLRSSDGDLTVLEGHTPLVTDVVPGEVRIEPDEGDLVRLAVHGGFLQVEGGDTRVTLLAGMAERAEEIDVARAERARDEAAARVGGAAGRAGAPGPGGGAPEGAAQQGDPELAQAEAALRRAEVRLEVAGAGG